MPSLHRRIHFLVLFAGLAIPPALHAAMTDSVISPPKLRDSLGSAPVLREVAVEAGSGPKSKLATASKC
jgi:hypothetical protein